MKQLLHTCICITDDDDIVYGIAAKFCKIVYMYYNTYHMHIAYD
jgi:hypothetical protein